MDRHKTVSILIIAVLLFTAVGTAAVSYVKLNEQSDPVSFYTTAVERDRYGNCVMDIDSDFLYGKGYILGDFVDLYWDNCHVRAIIVSNYKGVFTFEYFINVASDKTVSIACQFAVGSLDVGDVVKVVYREHSSREKYMPCYYSGTCDRKAWMTDEDFCNYRMIKTTGIREGVLYRSSDAFPNVTDIRAETMDSLFIGTDIACLIDMNETLDELRQSIKDGVVDAENAQWYLDNDRMYADYMSVKFLEDISYREIFEYIADNEGPYLIFCTLGKDRTGFIATVLEALMGATYDEMYADYCRTYVCLYDIEEGTLEYRLIVGMFNPVLIGLHDPTIMDDIESVDFFVDVSGYDYQHDAEKYLTETLGLSQETVDKIRRNIGA